MAYVMMFYSSSFSFKPTGFSLSNLPICIEKIPFLIYSFTVPMAGTFQKEGFCGEFENAILIPFARQLLSAHIIQVCNFQEPIHHNKLPWLEI